MLYLFRKIWINSAVNELGIHMELFARQLVYSLEFQNSGKAAVLVFWRSSANWLVFPVLYLNNCTVVTFASHMIHYLTTVFLRLQSNGNGLIDHSQTCEKWLFIGGPPHISTYTSWIRLVVNRRGPTVGLRVKIIFAFEFCNLRNNPRLIVNRWRSTAAVLQCFYVCVSTSCYLALHLRF